MITSEDSEDKIDKQQSKKLDLINKITLIIMKTIMKNIIIFDFDGVIVDSLDTMFKLYNLLCEKHKYLIRVKDKQEFSQFFHNNFYETMRQNGLTEQQINQIISDSRDKLIQHTKGMKPFDGINEMINALSNKYRLIIVTSNLSRAVKESLLFNHINSIKKVLGAEEEKSKIKKILCIKSDNPQSNVYYVGDTTGDIFEGKKVGVTTIATTWGYHKKNVLKKSKPDYIVDSPKKLVNLFENLNS